MCINRRRETDASVVFPNPFRLPIAIRIHEYRARWPISSPRSPLIFFGFFLLHSVAVHDPARSPDTRRVKRDRRTGQITIWIRAPGDGMPENSGPRDARGSVRKSIFGDRAGQNCRRSGRRNETRIACKPRTTHTERRDAAGDRRTYATGRT